MYVPHGAVGRSAVCDCGITYFFIVNDITELRKVEIKRMSAKIEGRYFVVIVKTPEVTPNKSSAWIVTSVTIPKH